MRGFFDLSHYASGARTYRVPAGRGEFLCMLQGSLTVIGRLLRLENFSEAAYPVHMRMLSKSMFK